MLLDIKHRFDSTRSYLKCDLHKSTNHSLWTSLFHQTW